MRVGLVRLEPSYEKTKLDRHDIGFSLRRIRIEIVDKYIYLGQTISDNKDFGAEINNRLKKAWGKYWSYKSLLKSKMTQKSKLEILNNCIIPSMTNGAQTWALTKELSTKYKQPKTE